MFIDGREFKRYNDDCYVSSDGDVYSTISKRMLNPMTRTVKGKTYKYIDVKGNHVNIHKIVYEAWVGPVPSNCQINHKDDDSFNNHYSNLYAGTQKENIKDCIDNNHRCGNRFFVTVLNKETDKIEKYNMIKDFLATTGHNVPNGSIKRLFKRKWFNEKYSVIEIERCRDYRSSNTDDE